MRKIHFHTNLDEARPYVEDLNNCWQGPVPGVGHEIVFDVGQGQGRGLKHFRLRVVQVRWSRAGDALIELHMPELPRMTIAEWSEWFKRFLREP